MLAATMSGFPSLDVRALDRARISRDPRFDGKFFIAVTSTRIYCRPICPVREAKRCNIRYYFSAAAAAEAGFRPCLRCRPEAAPGTPAWLGTSAVVRRALRLIDEGILDHSSVDDLAAKLGVGARHLHRLFVQHAGASPIVFAQTRRVHFAKRLLDETDLPITEIALAAGFGSLRRFNAVFKEIYKRAPRDLRRRSRASEAASGDVVLKLAYRPPYDFAQVLAFLRTRHISGVETVTDTTYARTVRLRNGFALIHVRCRPDEDALELRVSDAETSDLFSIVSTVRRVFDLAADPARTLAAFQADLLLGPLVRSAPGLRIPSAWDAFECAVRAIIGQQVSVRGARSLLVRLVERNGTRISTTSGEFGYLFPSAAEILDGDLTDIGLTTARIRALRALAQAVVERRIDFNGGIDETIAELTGIAGVGPWTAQYVALRGLGDPDAFPSSDLVLRRMASSSKALTARELEAMAERWRPWRAYAAMHLWHAAARRAR
jgi:AraC family transcriptional regulator of adaptative response / DNA-3-methyladenine glycosylase II